MTDTIDATAVTEATRRADFTAGLRALADWYDTHPDVPEPYLGSEMPYYPSSRTEFVNLARSIGADVAAVGEWVHATRVFVGVSVVVKMKVDKVRGDYRPVRLTDDEVADLRAEVQS